MRLSILDDYQGVALDMADWAPLRRRGIDIVVERKPFPTRTRRPAPWANPSWSRRCASARLFREPSSTGWRN